MLRMGFRLVFNLVTIHYFSWSIINLIDIRRSKRNVFRDFSPFSSLPTLSLYLHAALQDGSFPAPNADWEQGKVVSETIGTVISTAEPWVKWTGWRLLYLPHTIRSLVYQKCSGSEWPKLKVAGEKLKNKKKPFLGLVSLTSQIDIFSFIETMPLFSETRDEGKPKQKTLGQESWVVFTHSESINWN